MALNTFGAATLSLALADCIVCSVRLQADPIRPAKAEHHALLQNAVAQGAAKYEEFTARVANLGVGAGQDLKMDVFRWTSDEERSALIAALKDKNLADPAVVDAIQKGPSLGTIWTNETLGYTIRYAYRDSLPNGVERVVLITDRRFGSWSGQVWKPLKQPDAVDYPFALVELRLKQNGTGEGKVSVTTKVAVDEAGKSLALSGYDSAPVVLRNARREPGPAR